MDELAYNTAVYKLYKDKPPTNPQIDPITIAIIISIIIEVITAIKKSHDEKTIEEVVKYPTNFQRLLLKRIIRKQRGWSKSILPTGKKENEEIFQALLHTGSHATSEQLISAMRDTRTFIKE